MSDLSRNESDVQSSLKSTGKYYDKKNIIVKNNISAICRQLNYPRAN